MTNHPNFFTKLFPGSLVGADFSNAQLSGVIFANQDLTSAKFQNANLSPRVSSVDFTNTTLKDTCFIGDDLDRTNFSYAIINCADFSGTSLMKAVFGPTQNMLNDHQVMGRPPPQQIQ